MIPGMSFKTGRGRCAGIAWTASVVLAVLLWGGCGSGEPGADAKPEPGIVKNYERGPIHVVLSVDKKEPTIADRIRLRLEVTADENYEVRMPRFGEKLEQFGIVDYDTTRPELIEGNRTRQVRSYLLEPFLSGDYIIPAMKFGFSKKGEEGEHELETEPLTLTVRSLLPEAAAELKIHEIAPPEELPGEPVPTWWLVLGGGALVLLAVGGYLLVKRRRADRTLVPVIPAHELAFQQLEALVAENLPEQQRIKEFYSRISDILRHYIENRFGLHAPEQTTEEFLGALSATRTLTPPQKELLRAFLKHCDLVKFAEHIPGDEDIQRTFDGCKHFILETRELPGGSAGPERDASGRPDPVEPAGVA